MNLDEVQAGIDEILAELRERHADPPQAVLDMINRFTAALRQYAAPASLTDMQFGVVLTVVSSMMLDPNMPAATTVSMSNILAMAGQRFYDGVAQ